MSIYDCEPIREYDSGEFYGVIGLHIRGHVEDDMAVPVAEYELSYEWSVEDFTLDPPRRVWCRKVPREDGWSYVYSATPGRGAYPVTVVNIHNGWGFRCDLPGCENHYVKGSASSGFPVENVIEPPANRQNERFVYMCRRHARSFSDRLEAARREALAALASRGAA